MPVAPTPPSTLPEPEAALLDDLLAKYHAAQPHEEAWKDESRRAKRAWDERRDEIRASEKPDPKTIEDLRVAEATLSKVTSDGKNELRAAAAERDAALARAKAEYAKKESADRRMCKAHRENVKLARQRVANAESAAQARIRQRYAAERPAFFAEERRLNEIEQAADKAWRDPVNSDAMPKSVRVAFWDAVRAEAK